MNMKKTVLIIALALAGITSVMADDRPVTFTQLPVAAQQFINTNYPGDKVSFATVDDDIIRPEYQVVLASGVMLQFENDGRLEKIESRKGEMPSGLIPVQIIEVVKIHYPDAKIISYEVGKRTYEVKLSNRMELKFNSSFNIIEVDD